MCKLGLIDYLKQSGSVTIHSHGTFSDKMYKQLQGASSAVKNYIKDTSYKVDFYDANYMLNNLNKPWYSDGVRVIVKDLLNDKSYIKDVYNNPLSQKPFVRQIYEAIDLINSDKKPIDNMIELTKRKYDLYLKKLKNNM